MRLAHAEIAQGRDPSGTVILPGVLPWDDYSKRMETWDDVMISIGIRAEFWEGADTLLYPPQWLNRANTIALDLFLANKKRQAKAIGIDPGEGGDKTAMAAIDEWGLIELISKKTPNTAIITSEALAFMNKHHVPPEKVVFDLGGGKQHVDRLRDMGYPVQGVRFGEALRPDMKRGLTPFDERKDTREEGANYVSRRCQMYGKLRDLLDPSREVEWLAELEKVTGRMSGKSRTETKQETGARIARTLPGVRPFPHIASTSIDPEVTRGKSPSTPGSPGQGDPKGNTTNPREATKPSLGEWGASKAPNPGYNGISYGWVLSPFPRGFGIPASYTNLRSELALIPRMLDGEGRLKLPPKHPLQGSNTANTGTSKVKSLVEIIGHSPDEADALVIAVFAMTHHSMQITVSGG